MNIAILDSDPALSHAMDGLATRSRRTAWGAFAAIFVDRYDLLLPMIALAPAIYYFLPESLDPTTAMIAGTIIFTASLSGRLLGTLIFGHLAERCLLVH